MLKVYRAHTRRPPEQLETLCDEIRTARPLTTDRAIIASSVLMVEILVEQLRVLGAGHQARGATSLADLFAAHPDQAIFQSFPGAGKALAPRLLAAWGSDRQRFQDAANMQCFAGPAPVTVRSGKSKWVHRRFACPTFLCQTFHEFAAQSRLKSPWAKAYYQQMRGQGGRPSPRRPRLGLQVDSHYVSLLERPYALRRGPLPASSQAPGFASGHGPEPAPTRRPALEQKSLTSILRCLRGPERRSRKLARRISPIRRIVASLNRKRDALPAFGGATPKGERRSPVLDTETALPAGYASTH